MALAAVKSRITLLGNKKAQSQKLLRKDLAELCAAGKWDSARIRVRMTRGKHAPGVTRRAAHAARAGGFALRAA